MKETDLKTKNDEKHIAERMYSTRLKVTAGGIVILGFWAVVQTILSSFLVSDLNEAEFNDHPFIYALVLLFVLFVFSLIVLSFRIIILRGAIREADKRIAKNGYLAIAVYLMMIELFSFGFFVYSLLGDGDVSFSDFIILLLDITSFVLLLELVFFAKNLRKARAEIDGTEKVEMDGIEKAEIDGTKMAEMTEEN